MPLVFIITINWNGLDDTLECLESLNKIDYPNHKIVVIDNGSKENQADLIKQQFPKIKLIKNKINTGFCVANNQGIELATRDKADYVLLLNNDTIVKQDFLTKLINVAEKDKKTGILSPKILYYKTNKVWCLGGIISIPTGITILIGKGKKSKGFQREIAPDFLSGCAMLIKREVLEKVGLLDPIYFAYYEDADYCYKAKKAGFSLKVIPKSIVWHKKSASTGIVGSNKVSGIQAYYWGRNAIIFARKNLDIISRFFFFSGTLTFSLLHVIINSRKKEILEKYFQGLKEGFSYEIHSK